MMSTTSFSALAFYFLLLASSVESHTWLENIMLIGSNGSLIGTPGYPRGYGPRTVPNPDEANVYKVLGGADSVISPSVLMCKASQMIGSYTDGFGPLTAAPLDNIAMRYLENGHVTLNTTPRPANNGTVFVYGTTKPANTDTYAGIHRVWNAAGTGGDKRGKLLATRHYDDGRCFQVNNAAPLSVARQAAIGWSGGLDLPCQTDVQIPEDAGTSGKYTMYWVWEWPLMDAATGKVASYESYTSCLDINMIAKSSVGSVAKLAANAEIKGLGAALLAHNDQLANHFIVNPTAAMAMTEAPPFTMTGLPAAGSTAAATTQAPAKATTTAIATTASAQKPGVTVTVTSSIHNVVTVTVTRDAQATAAPASSGVFHPNRAPNPSPFLPRRLRIRGREVRN